MPIAIVAGSFDPPTVAHIDLIKRAYDLFGKVIVLVGVNPSKTKPFIFPQERVRLLQECFNPDLSSVYVQLWDGLTADFYKGNGRVLVRGLRTVSDFEAEMIQSHVNANLGLNTIFLPTTSENSYVSSSVVRQLLQFGAKEEAMKYLPVPVQDYILKEDCLWNSLGKK